MIVDTGRTFACAGERWIKNYLQQARQILGTEFRDQTMPHVMGYSFGDNSEEIRRFRYRLPVNFVEGRGVRLPSIVVRPGAPNAATTGCFSSVVRETLAGRDVVLPIGGDVVHAVAGAQNCVAGLLDLHDAPNADASSSINGGKPPVYNASLTPSAQFSSI